jgi:hypothetical protein
MQTVILFEKCLGFNDSPNIATQTMITSPRAKGAGSTELIDCLNVTVTPEGSLEKVPSLNLALATASTISNLSAGSRLLFGDGTNTNEWTGGTTVVNRFPAVYGPVCHTPQDVRVSGGLGVYKSLNTTPTMQPALIGTYTGPTIRTALSAMPAFKQALVYNANLYAVNSADSKWLQHSMDYGYDLWALGNAYLAPGMGILQFGQIPGCLLMAHENGITVCTGATPKEFTRKFYPCAYINNTLHSGLISKVYGYAHVFLCDDGVYTVGQDGALVNLTVDQTDHIDALNTTYSCANLVVGKYIAFGDTVAVEYDFRNKAVLKRSPLGVTGACMWNGVPYLSAGHNIVTPSSTSDTTDSACSITFPYSDLGMPGRKMIEALYFTGILSGTLTATFTSPGGEGWSVDVSEDTGAVTNYRIKTPKALLENHVSLRLDAVGSFRLESLRAVLAANGRNR